MRDFFVIVGSLLIAVLVAAFAVPRFIDWAPYKREIETRIRDATGIEVALAGPLRIEILPKLALNAQDVIIDTKDAKVSAARLRAEVSVASLFGDDAASRLARARRGRRQALRGRGRRSGGRAVGVLSKDHALQIDSHDLEHHRDHARRWRYADCDDRAWRGEPSGVSGPLAPERRGRASATFRDEAGSPSDRRRRMLNRHVSIAFDADGEGDARGWRLTFEGQAPRTVHAGHPRRRRRSCPERQGRAADRQRRHRRQAPLWRAQAKAHGELRALRFDEIEISRGRRRAQIDRAGSARPHRRSQAHARSFGAAPRARSARRGERRWSRRSSARAGALPIGERSESARRRRDGVAAVLAQRRLQPRRRDGELADESFGNLHLSGTGRSADAVVRSRP